MERIPEPELMDDFEQAKAYAEADFSEPHQTFIDCFQHNFTGYKPTRVLDLGCGPADITQRFARAFPDCRIVGIDGSKAMLEFGNKAIAHSGLQGRVRLIEARLPGAALPDGNFDTIISNSLLHHLAQPAVLWDAVKSCGSGEAVVCIMDLMRPVSAEVVDALVEHYAGGEPEILQRDFRHSLLAAYLPQEVRAQLRCAGLDCLRVEVVSDRHLLVAGRLA